MAISYSTKPMHQGRRGERLSSEHAQSGANDSSPRYRKPEYVKQHKPLIDSDHDKSPILLIGPADSRREYRVEDIIDVRKCYPYADIALILRQIDQEKSIKGRGRFFIPQ